MAANAAATAAKSLAIIPPSVKRWPRGALQQVPAQVGLFTAGGFFQHGTDASWTTTSADGCRFKNGAKMNMFPHLLRSHRRKLALQNLQRSHRRKLALQRTRRRLRRKLGLHQFRRRRRLRRKLGLQKFRLRRRHRRRLGLHQLRRRRISPTTPTRASPARPTSLPHRRKMGGSGAPTAQVRLQKQRTRA